MSAHSCLSVLLSLSRIVYICTVLFEQINDDDDDDRLVPAAKAWMLQWTRF